MNGHFSVPNRKPSYESRDQLAPCPKEVILRVEKFVLQLEPQLMDRNGPSMSTKKPPNAGKTMIQPDGCHLLP